MNRLLSAMLMIISFACCDHQYNVRSRSLIGIGLKASSSDEPIHQPGPSLSGDDIPRPPADWWQCDLATKPPTAMMKLKLTKPVLRNDGIGNTLVYPSSYRGNRESDSMLEEDYVQAVKIYSDYYHENRNTFLYFEPDKHVDGSEVVQPSNDIFKSQHAGDIALTRTQTKCFLVTFLRTAIGRQIVFELKNAWNNDRSKVVEITYGEGSRNTTAYANQIGAYVPNQGSGCTIGLVQRYCWNNCQGAWATERQKYGFYHELVHAYFASKGTLAKGNMTVRYLVGTGWLDNLVETNELQSIGLGPFVNLRPTENLIRADLKKPPRPFFVNKTEIYVIPDV